MSRRLFFLTFSILITLLIWTVFDLLQAYYEIKIPEISEPILKEIDSQIDFSYLESLRR